MRYTPDMNQSNDAIIIQGWYFGLDNGLEQARRNTRTGHIPSSYKK